MLGIDRMAGDPFVAATAGKALFGERGDLVIRLLVLLSILSGINACLLMAPRVVLRHEPGPAAPRRASRR